MASRKKTGSTSANRSTAPSKRATPAAKGAGTKAAPKKAPATKASVGKASVGKASVGKASVGKASTKSASGKKASTTKGSKSKATKSKATKSKAAKSKTTKSKAAPQKARATKPAAATVGSSRIASITPSKSGEHWTLVLESGAKATVASAPAQNAGVKVGATWSAAMAKRVLEAAIELEMFTRALSMLAQDGRMTRPALTKALGGDARAKSTVASLASHGWLN